MKRSIVKNKAVAPAEKAEGNALPSPFRDRFSRIRSGTCLECYFANRVGSYCLVLRHGVSPNGGACTAFVSGDMVEALAEMMGAKPVGQRDTSERLKLAL